jgi:adenylate cyclase
MALEIERKFLVNNRDWMDGYTGEYYVQGYLFTDPEKVVRIRIVGEKAFLTVKGKNEGPLRKEYEYPIALDDAKEMIDSFCKGRVVEKMRYKIVYANKLWEVDVFLGANEGLIIAEVELDYINEPVELPAWIGMEVTEDPRYYNSSLAKHPFSRWE